MNPKTWTPSSGLLFLLFLLAAGCKGGVDSGPDYEEALRGFRTTWSQVKARGKEALSSSDPVQLRQALEGLLPSARTALERLEEIQVGESLAAVHEALLGSVREGVRALDDLAGRASTTVLREGKEALKSALRRVDDALQAMKRSLR